MKTNAVSHTPGPWHVGAVGGYNASNVYAEDPVHGDDKLRAIASVYGIFANTGIEECTASPRCAEGMANARLIAAAPELLVLLAEFAVEDCQCNAEYFLGLKKRARATISNVTGLAS